MTPATTLITAFPLLSPGRGCGCGAATILASATTGDPGVWPLVRFVVVVLAIAAPIYAVACWWFPYARCGKCGNAGFIADSSGKHFRRCRRCKGNRPLRFGRRAYNYIQRSRSAS